ncbi:hypothetical protein BGX27_005429 [Mortierella sp. AM989]|nr:hypothetical protein BGX27_005429 [Mortierella sp. AM989]
MSRYPLNDDASRRLRVEQESWFPGLAYAGAAAIGSAVIVNNAARSMPVKLLTPLAMAAATGAYFLPAHADQFRRTWIPMDLSIKPDESSLSKFNPPVNNLKQSAQRSTSEMRDMAMDTPPRLIPSSMVTPDRMEMSNTMSSTQEMAGFKENLPENPSSSRWSWWKSSYSTTPMNKETDSKMRTPKRRDSTTTDHTVVIDNTNGKPRKILVDKAVASAAIKGHDDLINRASLLGRNVEETALKVHENVYDAAVPKRRQSRHEKRPIEISRQASQSDLRDGKFIIRVTENSDPGALPERVRRGSIKKDIHHGLENLEKRASMIHQGVEHLEHSINKRMQKALEEEAEFWHQQSLKEEARSRGGERAM